MISVRNELTWIASTGTGVVLCFFCLWLICWLPFAFILAKKLAWQPTKETTPEQKLPLVLSLYFFAPLALGAIIWLGAGSWLDYGWHWQLELLTSLASGLGLGLLGISLVFAVELLLGWVKWHRENHSRLYPVVLPILALGLGVGAIEELVFRGFVFQELSQDYGMVSAAIVSSLIFALLHLLWEQQETLPQLPGLWLMGMVLVLARLFDGGSLGLAWGLHTGWIVGLTCIDSAALISYTGEGAAWITGIGKQPLAGLAGIACLLLTAASLALIFR